MNRIIIILFLVVSIGAHSDDVGFLEQAERTERETESNMPYWYTDTNLVEIWGMDATEKFVSLYSSASNKDATAYKIGASMYLADRLFEKDNVIDVYSHLRKYYSEYYEHLYGNAILPENVTSELITKQFKDNRIKERALNLIEEYRLLYD